MQSSLRGRAQGLTLRSMSLLGFIAALVSALAWPLAVVVIVLILRKHVPEFLRSIRKVKFSSFELEMERTRADVESAVALTSDSPESRPTVQVELESPTADPTTTILRAYRLLEEELARQLGEAGVKDADKKTANQLVALGRQKSMFNDSTAEAVRGVSVLRNLAAHGHGERTTAREAAEYVDLINAILFTLSVKPRDK
jgi:hypothetical protein